MPYFFEIHLAFAHLRSGARVHVGGRNSFVSFIAFFSVLGIALGVAALVVVPAIMNGFQKEVRQAMLNVVPHWEVRQADGLPLRKADALEQSLRQQPQVVAAQPFVESAAVLLAGDTMRGVRVLGLDWSQEKQVTNLSTHFDAQAQTALLARSGQKEAGKLGAAVLGAELAQALGVGVGDTLQFFSPDRKALPEGAVTNLPKGQALQVAGIVRTGYYTDDASLLLMPYAEALSYLHLKGPNGVRVKLRNPKIAPQLGLDWVEHLSQDMFVRDWTQHNRTWFEAIPLQKRLIAVLLAAIVAVAVFNLVSSLVMVVTDKRGEVAILRTLGASPTSIVRIFMLQGSILGVLGVTLGLIVGLLVASNIGALVAALEAIFGVHFLDKSVYFLDYMPSDPRFSDILWVVLLALFLAFLATLYPGWRAARLQPAQVLSHG